LHPLLVCIYDTLFNNLLIYKGKSMPINIYMTSFFRIAMTLKAVGMIHERTYPDSFKLHIFDNDSDLDTQRALINLLNTGKIESLHLDKRNTGCLYNKGVFHMMTDSNDKYYCVTDNDVYPPKLSPDWLSQMIAIMEAHPDLGLLAPQLPPQCLQEPYLVGKDIVRCLAVGNTLKIIRTEAFPLKSYTQSLGAYGDDGLVSKMMREEGWAVAFCRNIFCYHAGQCTNWGYTPEQVAMDPRKSGYGKPYTYEIENLETFEPADKYKI
jgi:hypothetical protein